MAQKKVSQDRKTRILFIINHSILLGEDCTVDYFFAKLEEGWVKTLLIGFSLRGVELFDWFFY